MSKPDGYLPTLAVMGGRQLYLSTAPDEPRPLSLMGREDGFSLIALCQACAAHGVSQLWIVGIDSAAFDYTRDQWGGWDLQPSAAECTQHGGAGWIHAVRAHSAAQVDVAFPALLRDAPWETVTDARILLSALMTFRSLLRGVGYHRSPSATAARLVRRLHTGPHALPLELGMAFGDWPAPAKDGNTETPLAWISPRAEQQMAGCGYLHAYDKNGAYLAACSALAVGAGRCEHGGALDVLNPPGGRLRPGYYLVDVEHLVPTQHTIPAWSGKRLRGSYSTAWVTLPTLQLMMDRGESPQVYEHWMFEAHHRPLEPWYRLLRDARALLMAQTDDPAGALALAAVKATYAAFCGGYLASTGEKRGWDRSHDTLYRPDVRHAIIATARTNLIRRIEAVAAADGMTPIAVGGIDTIFYAGADPWPLRFAAQRLPSLPVGDTSLRGWKYKGTAEITPELRAALLSGDAPTKVLESLFGALSNRLDEASNG